MMVNRTALLFSLVFLLLTFEGCVGVGLWSIIKKSTLSVDEVEKVNTVKLIEADQLNLNSYKVIKNIQGLSCVRFKHIMRSGENKLVEKPSRKKAIEQLKIRAVKTGGNVITNVVCLVKTQGSFPFSEYTCYQYIQCTADAIQVD